MQCTFGSNSGLDTHKHHGLSATRDSIAARLRKPEGFRGSPIFADDRQVDPLTDISCQIRPDKSDTEELTYDLLISDFSRCGVLKRNVSLLLLLVLPLAVFRSLKVPYSISLLRFPNLVFLSLKIQVSSVVTPYLLVKSYRRFEKMLLHFFHRLSCLFLEFSFQSLLFCSFCLSSFQYVLIIRMNKTCALSSKKTRKTCAKWIATKCYLTLHSRC